MIQVTGLTIPFRKPDVVRQMVGKLVVKAIDHRQYVLYQEDGVIVSIQYPAIVLNADILVCSVRH